jgi:glutamate-1-semialdehyde aminotransferase
MQALWNIRADLATYGKVLGGGMPIGVLAGKAEFMDALDGGAWSYGDDSSPEVGVTFFAGTFVRHPVALAAAWSVLTHLKESGPALQENLNAKTDRMVARLNNLLDRHEVTTHIQNCGSFFYFNFGVDHPFGSIFYYLLREKGVHLQEGFPCFLTTTHSDEDIDHIVRAFQDSITEMQEGELLPRPMSRDRDLDTKAQSADISSASLAQMVVWGVPVGGLPIGPTG